MQAHPRAGAGTRGPRIGCPRGTTRPAINGRSRGEQVGWNQSGSGCRQQQLTGATLSWRVKTGRRAVLHQARSQPNPATTCLRQRVLDQVLVLILVQAL